MPSVAIRKTGTTSSASPSKKKVSERDSSGADLLLSLAATARKHEESPLNGSFYTPSPFSSGGRSTKSHPSSGGDGKLVMSLYGSTLHTTPIKTPDSLSDERNHQKAPASNKSAGSNESSSSTKRGREKNSGDEKEERSGGETSSEKSPSKKACPDGPKEKEGSEDGDDANQVITPTSSTEKTEEDEGAASGPSSQGQKQGTPPAYMPFHPAFFRPNATMPLPAGYYYPPPPLPGSFYHPGHFNPAIHPGTAVPPPGLYAPPPPYAYPPHFHPSLEAVTAPYAARFDPASAAAAAAAVAASQLASHVSAEGGKSSSPRTNRIELDKLRSSVTDNAVPSSRRCIIRDNKMPPQNWRSMVAKADDIPMPDFHSIVNYPEYITRGRAGGVDDQGRMRCVMCGNLRLCLYKGDRKAKEDEDNQADAPTHIIPKQNKGVCTSCDIAVWTVMDIPGGGLDIKWCKGCKNFRPWPAFGEKPVATKCCKCRERQKEKYASQKDAQEKKETADLMAANGLRNLMYGIPRV